MWVDLISICKYLCLLSCKLRLIYTDLTLTYLLDHPLVFIKHVIEICSNGSDFIRSVDGVFERAARFGDMLGTHVTELLTDNLREALVTVTPDKIQQLAARYLQDDQLCVCRAGAV